MILLHPRALYYYCPGNSLPNHASVTAAASCSFSLAGCPVFFLPPHEAWSCNKARTHLLHMLVATLHLGLIKASDAVIRRVRL